MIGELLKQKNFTVATAESCTGGLLASTLTDVDGSSAYVKGGIVSYTNAIKISVLHVNAETLQKFGAVSSETAREMASNVRKIFLSTIGISTTGVAGKSVEGKSVGTVFVAVDAENFSAVKEFHFDGTRTEIKAQTVDAALKLLTEHLT
ncbi:MAG: CinA family protein [Selenomonadaceae bacterium]|nr:CinA family protein [Selenomonadaceae bacterium]